tara:strand:- start:40 stop:354 length:315 start_codon:yes stop_codon:yes gene_type:complete
MKEIIIVADYTEDSTLTATELCEACRIDERLLHEFVANDIIMPESAQSGGWVFDMSGLKRLRLALRLQRDLELNTAGLALVLQLLDEMDEMRELTNVYHRHYLK